MEPSSHGARVRAAWKADRSYLLAIDPADRLTLDDEVRRALAVVIDRLSPAERTSFILHDVFGFPSAL